MDTEYAIEVLDELVELARKDYTIAGFLLVANMAAEIREVLEKQQLKKVSIWPYPSCPNCGSVEVQAGAESIELNYCQDCGQKLDWRVE